MEAALAAASQALSMFILIAVGFIAARRGIISVAATKNFCNFLLMIVSPVILSYICYRPLVPEQMRGLLLALVLSVLAHLVFIALSRILVPQKNHPQYQIEQLSIVYSNCGFMAFPILKLTIGADGVFYATAYSLVFNIFLWFHGVRLLSPEKKISWRELLITPGTIGAAAGFFLYFSQLTLPGFLVNSMSLISDLNTPLAMVVIGVFLSELRLPELIKNPRFYWITFIKLLAAPAALLAIFSALRIGRLFPESRDAIFSVLTCASCASGASSILLSAKVGKDSTYGAALVCLTSVFMVVTMPLILAAAELLI